MTSLFPSAPPGLTITRTDRSGGVRVLTAVGDIDTATVGRLQAELAACERVVVDLSRVEFLGLCGVHALFVAQDRADRLAIVTGGHAVARSFEVSGVADVLDVHAGLESALASASEGVPG